MGCLTCVLFWVAVPLIVLKVYLKLTTGWCRSNICLVGKTAIITGGNSGIGFETAADFAKRGAKVILACRDEARGKEAAQRIIRQTDNLNIFFKQLDLASLKSVRQFAEDINKSEDRLDILVNNAGIGNVIGPRQTEDGLHTLMQSNHFGHFLLTNLLLDLIIKTPNSRVVNVSSMGAKYAEELDVNNLNKSQPKGWREMEIYTRSKLCNVLFTIELAEKLKGTSATAYSLHPGAVLTNIFNKMPKIFKIVTEEIIGWFMKDSQEGAQTTIYCSVEKGIEHLSGEYFSDCQVVKRFKRAQDPTLPKKLWKVSEELVHLNT